MKKICEQHVQQRGDAHGKGKLPGALGGEPAEEKVRREGSSQNVHEFDGAQADIDEVIGMARTPSMFPGHRVLIVRNYPWLFQKKGKEELKEFQEGAGARLLEYAAGADHSEYASMIIMTVDAQYYKDSSPRNCGLTAYGKKLLQKSSGYEMNTLNRAELEGFIGKRVKAAGKQMTRNQLNYLIDLSGYYNEESVYRLDDLENDLHKILSIPRRESRLPTRKSRI